VTKFKPTNANTSRCRAERRTCAAQVRGFAQVFRPKQARDPADHAFVEHDADRHTHLCGCSSAGTGEAGEARVEDGQVSRTSLPDVAVTPALAIIEFEGPAS
jgi:hypothetical protein